MQAMIFLRCLHAEAYYAYLRHFTNFILDMLPCPYNIPLTTLKKPYPTFVLIIHYLCARAQPHIFSLPAFRVNQGETVLRLRDNDTLAYKLVTLRHHNLFISKPCRYVCLML